MSLPVPSLSASSVAVAEFVSEVPSTAIYPESMSSAISTVSSAPGARSSIGQVMIPAASEHAGVMLGRCMWFHLGLYQLVRFQ